jgi:peptidoglycan/LPS O-acetylase OafA/YrhL
MRYEIQILRGISVIAVILYHFNKTSFPQGYLGVDIFFLISGFLITGTILNDLERRNFTFKNFYIKRARRILPGLMSTLSLTILIGIYNLTSEQFFELIKGIKYSIFFISNIFFSQKIDYFSIDSDKNLIINLWSLSIEEQFYLLYPILLVTIFKFARKYIFLVIVTSTFISVLFYSETLYSLLNLNKIFFNYDNYIFYSPFTRAWQLLLGGVIYFLRKKLRPKINSKYFLFILSILLLLETNFSILYLLILITGIILLSDFKIALGISSKLLIHIGNISYSLYLIHQPIFAGIRNNNYFSTPNSIKFVDLNSWINVSVIFLVIYILSLINYLFIEQKFRLKKVEIYKVAPYLVLFFLLIFSISNIYNILYPEFELSNKNSLTTRAGTNYLIGDDNILCISREKIDNTCTYGSGSSKLYFLGDSSVGSMVGGFLSNDILNSYTVTDYTQAGCYPLIGFCDFTIGKQFYEDVSNITDSTIVMGGTWRFEEIRDSLFLETINLLLENENTILFLGFMPKSPVDEIMYYKKNKKYFISNNPEFYKEMFLKNEEYKYIFSRHKDELKNSNFYYIDIFEIFCPKKVCKFTDSNNLNYFNDSTHLSQTGATDIFKKSKFKEYLLSK